MHNKSDLCITNYLKLAQLTYSKDPNEVIAFNLSSICSLVIRVSDEANNEAAAIIDGLWSTKLISVA